MNKIFRIEKGVQVPDGTMVYEIIGPAKSSMEKIPITEEHSLALGILDPNEKSAIHIHPIISHLTWVISGKLTVGMKDKYSDKMYFIDVLPNETVLTEPCTFFQLINNTDEECRVLYIVSPAFIFEVDETGKILYNDQIILNKTWEQLEHDNYKITELDDMEQIKKSRKESLLRLELKSK